MNKIVSILFIGILSALSVDACAQKLYVKFFSLKNPGQYLIDDRENNTNLSLKYIKGEIHPQYLIMSGDSRFLVNFGNTKQSPSELTFVDGKLVGDSVLILQSGSKYLELNIKSADFSPALFSFRLIDKDDADGDFLIESWTNGEIGEWILLREGKPSIVRTSLTAAIHSEADIFNVFNGSDQYIVESPLSSVPYTVSADYGRVIIKGAKNQRVMISDIYGQTLVNKVLPSDDAVIAAPSGIAFVAVNNDPGVKVLVK